MHPAVEPRSGRLAGQPGLWRSTHARSSMGVMSTVRPHGNVLPDARDSRSARPAPRHRRTGEFVTDSIDRPTDGGADSQSSCRWSTAGSLRTPARLPTSDRRPDRRRLPSMASLVFPPGVRTATDAVVAGGVERGSAVEHGNPVVVGARTPVMGGVGVGSVIALRRRPASRAHRRPGRRGRHGGGNRLRHGDRSDASRRRVDPGVSVHDGRLCGRKGHGARAHQGVQAVLDGVLVVRVVRTAGRLGPQVRDLVRATQLQGDEVVDLGARHWVGDAVLGVHAVPHRCRDIPHRGRVARDAHLGRGDPNEHGPRGHAVVRVLGVDGTSGPLCHHARRRGCRCADGHRCRGRRR